MKDTISSRYNFDFSQNIEQNIDAAKLISDIFIENKANLNDFFISDPYKKRLIDTLEAVFELAKLNKSKVGMKIDYEKKLYYIEIENKNFSFNNKNFCTCLNYIFSGSHTTNIIISPSNKISIIISFDLKLKPSNKKQNINVKELSSFEKIKLSKHTVIKTTMTNITYGTYPAYINVNFIIDGEEKLITSTLLIMESPNFADIKLLIPKKYNLAINDEDLKNLERKLWSMYFIIKHFRLFIKIHQI